MGFKRIVLNALLALAVALPLAAMESRVQFGQTDGLAQEKKQKAALQEPVPLTAKSGSGLVEMVSAKVTKRPSPKKMERQLDTHIRMVAEQHGVSPALVKAVIKAESGFDPNAVSSVGAVGLMQVMPSTARRVGVKNPQDPHANIEAGVKYLKMLLNMFEGDEALAVAAYNSGPGKVRKYGGIPPYRQTQVFVERVMSYYRSYLKS